MSYRREPIVVLTPAEVKMIEEDRRRLERPGFACIVNGPTSPWLGDRFGNQALRRWKMRAVESWLRDGRASVKGRPR